jgi:hypothetical protein
MCKNFIGHATVESLVKNSISSRNNGAVNINIISIEETRNVVHGIFNIDTVTIVSFIDDAGDIHYVRIRTTSFLSSDGRNPLYGDKHYHDWAMQARNCIQNWLTYRGYILVEAMVAMPKNYKYINGYADFLKFDKERGFYTDTTDTATRSE